MKKLLQWILIIIVMLVIVISCAKEEAKDSLTPEQKAKKDRENLIYAMQYTCKDFINKHLNDPDSAIYGNEPYDKIAIEKKPGIWIVQRNLRARNAFNALVKATYICTIKYDGKNFYLISLKQR